MRTQLLVAATCLIGCSKPGAAPEPKPPEVTARPAVPADLAVPDDHKLALVATARGVQIYDCVADAAGGLAWKLHAPRADLFDQAGAQIGTHFGGVDKNLPAGPYWEAKDGSRVHAGKPASAPNPGAIPLLRLEAADTFGNGIFARVSFVQRLATSGGVAPEGACDGGKQTEVAYTAQYYFYTAP